MRLFLIALGISIATLRHAYCIEYFKVPFSFEIKKEPGPKGTLNKKVFTFDLPSDNVFELDTFSYQGEQVGDVGHEVRFLPDKKNVRKVEIEVFARVHPDSWTFIWFHGPDSILRLTYQFVFIRQPNADVIKNELLTELNDLIRVTEMELTGFAKLDKVIFNRKLSKYPPETVLTKEFVSAVAQSVYKPYFEHVYLPAEALMKDFILRAAKFPDLQNLGYQFLDVVKARLSEYREWYSPIAKLYDLNLAQMLDTPLLEVPDEPGGSDVDFVRDAYKTYVGWPLDPNNESDQSAIMTILRRVEFLGREKVREEIANYNASFVNRIYEDNGRDRPTKKNNIEWCEQLIKKECEFILEAIPKLALSSSPEIEFSHLPDGKELFPIRNIHESCVNIALDRVIEILYLTHLKKKPDQKTIDYWKMKMKKYAQHAVESAIIHSFDDQTE